MLFMEKTHLNTGTLADVMQDQHLFCWIHFCSQLTSFNSTQFEESIVI